MNEELSALKIAIAQKIIAGNHIFSDLKMNLNFGEIVALLGPSGCGNHIAKNDLWLGRIKPRRNLFC